jgi:hypothetical protein
VKTALEAGWTGQIPIIGAKLSYNCNGSFKKFRKISKKNFILAQQFKIFPCQLETRANCF